MTKLEKYYEREITFVRNSLIGNTDQGVRSNIVWCSIQRCLGAADYVQLSSKKYLDVASLFEATRERLQALEHDL